MARPANRIVVPRRPRSTRRTAPSTRTVHAGRRTTRRKPRNTTVQDDSPFQRTTTLKLKERGINRSVSIVSGIFFLCVVLYIIRAAMGFFSATISTTLVDMGSRDAPESVRGVIIRNEVVHVAPRSGQVMFEVNEDERVTSGIRVASVGNISAAQELIASQQENEEGIRNLALRRTEISPVTAEAVARINDYMTSVLVSRAHSFTTRDLSDIYTLRDRISGAVSSRNAQLIDDNIHVSGDLQRMNQQIREMLGNELSDMHATTTGIVSFITDGYEHVFTPDNMTRLLDSDMHTTIDPANLVPNREVEAGDPVFRVVGNVWYIATYMTIEMAADFRVAETVVLFISSDALGQYVPMLFRIHRIDRQHTEAFVIFRSTRNVHEFVNQRIVYIQTTDTVQRGLRIPNSAIVSRRFFQIPWGYIHGNELQHYIRVLDEYGPVNVSVTLADIMDSSIFAFVLEETQGVEEGDVLVPSNPDLGYFTLRPGNLYTMRGVYRANDGFADFRVINMPTDELDPNDFTILDPATNFTIRRFDIIVTDPHAVHIHQGMRIR